LKSLTRLFVPLCLLAYHAPLPAQEPASSEMVVIDLRPKEEKEGFGLAELSGKCNKEVFRIPDVASDPLKVEVLKTDLAQMLTVDSGGKTLTVLNWSVYYNKQTQGGGGGMLESVGIQGYSVPGKKKEKHPGSKCSHKESAGGWYEGKEATTLYFPLISEFEGTFAGKPLNVRVVFSPPRKIEGKFDGATADADALLQAVHKTSEAVAMAIAQ